MSFHFASFFILNLKSSICNLLTVHAQELFNSLDPVKDVSIQKENIKTKNLINFHYILPLICTAGIEFDTFYLLAQNAFHYSPTEMDNMYTHKLFPVAIRAQADVIGNVGVSSLVFIYLLLICKQMDNKFNMIVFVDQKDLFVRKLKSNGKGNV